MCKLILNHPAATKDGTFRGTIRNWFPGRVDPATGRTTTLVTLANENPFAVRAVEVFRIEELV